MGINLILNPKNTPPEAVEEVAGLLFPLEHNLRAAQVYALGTVMFEMIYGHPAFLDHNHAAFGYVQVPEAESVLLREFLEGAVTRSNGRLPEPTRNFLLQMLGTADERPTIEEVEEFAKKTRIMSAMTAPRYIILTFN